MRLKKLDLKYFTLFIVLNLVFFNCENQESLEEIEDSEVIADLQVSAEVDNISTVIGDVIISSFESYQELDGGRLNNHQHGLPDCVTITRVAQQNFREVTIDFGNNGCSINGNELKGKLVYSYTRNPDAREILINYNTVDFYFDEKFVEGSRTILKQRANDNGNPQFTHTLNLIVTWPNDLSVSREGVRIREWIEGFGSGVFSDNVFEVTGNWKTTFRNGNSHAYEVIVPLRREVICQFFVSGSVEIKRTHFGGILDYGGGDCDNMAIFTNNNGTVREIVLD